jgi:hypothetical protein
VRYLQQIKARNTALIYHACNVFLCSIEKRDSLQQFNFHGTAVQLEHLKPPGDKEKHVQISQVDTKQNGNGISSVPDRGQQVALLTIELRSSC